MEEKRSDVVPDIEPGYGRRKPTPIPLDQRRKLILESKLPENWKTSMLEDLIKEKESRSSG